MKLNFAIICDNAFTDGEGRLNIVQTFDTIKAENFPALHPRITIVTNYGLEENDKNKTYTQKVVIIQKSTGKEIATNKIESKSPRQDTRSIQFISYFLGVAFDEGIYDVVITLEDKKIHSFPLCVERT